MITGIELHISLDDVQASTIKSRTTDNGDKYWIIRLATNSDLTDVLMFIDDADLKALSAKISTALEERTCQSESATYQCSVGITGSTESSESTTGST